MSYHVRSQVNTQDSDGAQGQRDVDQDEEEERGDLWDVTGQSVSNGFFQVVKDQTACRTEARWRSDRNAAHSKSDQHF